MFRLAPPKIGRSRRPARMTGFEPLEARDQPAGGLLADLNTTGSPAFLPFPMPGGTAGGAIGQTLYFTAADGTRNPGLYQSDGTAAGTKLVRDLSPDQGSQILTGPLAANTQPVLAAGGKVYFAGRDAEAGNELWATDGTTTKRVADLSPGAANSDLSFVAAVGGRAVFQASVRTPMAGYPVTGLYGSDGTAGGTVALTPADGSGYQSSPVATGGKVYFSVTTYSPTIFNVTSTIWETDGTKAGTKAFATLPAGAIVGFAADGRWAAAADGNLYFSASAEGSGTELWVSDGTAAGTKLLKDINPTSNTSFYPGDFSVSSPRSSSPQFFTAVRNAVYFAADDGTHGQELWKTDGTAAGTVMVKDLSPTVGSPQFELTGTPSGSKVRGLTAFDGNVYFAAEETGTSGPQFYVSNGTAAGTVKLTSAAPTAGSNFWVTQEPAVVGPVGGKLLFAISDATTGRQLWSTDGTAAGTAMVKAIGSQQTLADRVWAGPVAVGMAGNKLLFSADDGVNGRQLWSTDGTAARTGLVARINPTNQGSDPESFLTLGANALFVASDGPGKSAVFATDGTPAPVALVRFAPAAGDTLPVSPGPLTKSGAKAYFVAGDGIVGRELWVTDGTVAGTRRLKAVTPPAADAMSSSSAACGFNNLTDVGGTLYFTLDLPGTGQELWKTDGTTAGTTKVKNVTSRSSADAPSYSTWPPTQPLGAIRQLTAVGGKLFFAADDGFSGDELWVSDGTLAGTRLVKDINTPAAGSTNSGSVPTDLTAFNGKLYFIATDGAAGRQLWVSDGTSFGTKQVAAVNPTNVFEGSPQPASYERVVERGTAVAGGKLFLTAYSEANGGKQLWATDGTAAGTKPLTNIPAVPPYMNAGVGGLTAVGAKVFFVANDSTGRQIWVSDGTQAGTRKVKTIGPAASDTNPFPVGATPQVLTVVGDKVLFLADDGMNGRELWVTDGTATGTTLAKDFAAGKASGLPYESMLWPTPPTAAVVGGRLLLAVADATTGAEPWSVPLADLGLAGPPVVPPTVPPPVSPPPATGTGVEVVGATFSGPRAGVFDRVTVRFSGAVNAATVSKATVSVTGPGGAVGVSSVLPVAGSNGTAFTLMLSRGQTAAGTYNAAVGPGVATATGSAVPPFTATAVLGAPTVPPPVSPPPAPAQVTAGVVRAFNVAATAGVAWSGNLASVTLPSGPEYKVTVFWGDGRTATGTLTRNTPTSSAYTISAGHTYADSGNFKVMVRVTGAGRKTVLSIDTTATVERKK